MVKFGKQLEANIVQAWEDYYIDYGRLKGLIKAKAGTAVMLWESPEKRAAARVASPHLSMPLPSSHERFYGTAARTAASEAGAGTSGTVSADKRRGRRGYHPPEAAPLLSSSDKRNSVRGDIGLTPVETGPAGRLAIEASSSPASDLGDDGQAESKGAATTAGSPRGSHDGERDSAMDPASIPLARQDSVGTKFAVELEQSVKVVNDFFMSTLEDYDMQLRDLTGGGSAARLGLGGGQGRSHTSPLTGDAPHDSGDAGATRGLRSPGSGSAAGASGPSSHHMGSADSRTSDRAQRRLRGRHTAAGAAAAVLAQVRVEPAEYRRRRRAHSIDVEHGGGHARPRARSRASSAGISDMDEYLDDDELQERGIDSLKRAFIDLYRHANMLESFKMMNYTAIVKILKKHDKKIGKAFSGKEPESQVARRMLGKRVMAWVERLPWVTDKRLHGLVRRIENAWARRFTSGDRQVARMELLVKQERETNWVDFETGLRCGGVCVLLVWVLWDCLVDTSLSDQSSAAEMAAAVPLYRGTGCLLLLAWCWGLDIYVWNRARVNYLYIFDCDTRSSLGYQAVWREASNLTIFYLINFLLFYKTIRRATYRFIPAPVYPISLVLVLVWRAFWPWSHRRGMWSTLGNVVTAPFGRCLFRDTFAGDVMTSLVKVFADLAYSACFLGSGEFLKLGPIGGPSIATPWCAHTSAYLLVISPIIHAAPLWFRFMQNLRRYRDTKDRFPHLANAAKYAFALCVGLFGAFHPNYKHTAEGVTAYQVSWLIIYVCSTLYTYSWDVTMDWSLLRFASCGNSRHPGLRKHIMFRRKFVYWLAVPADFILRFLWTFTLVPANQLPPFVSAHVNTVLLPFLAAAEVCRRTMWAFFRLENEHLNNVGNFRRIDYVPLHFETAVKATEASKEANHASRRRTAMLEAVVFVVVVVSLGVFAAVSHFV